ncbi:hypothetical protein GOP47_0009061 [Adiantum capillus-veneris]|uniref:RING-type E3 ubiquitin transferase n=1 Tax=Adiantum capillus-veneris TaxID=13818 RepID=A0A9D4UZG9_ADICA|nr:hypothetical protein GOP47_0009061 [Adiantum capillus-veneris]
MSSSFWILTCFLSLHLPWTLVDATALPPPLSRRFLLSSNTTLTSPPPSSSILASTDACNTIAACNSRILPHSRTLTIAVVAIFAACILMAFVSVYARKFCIREGNSYASYHSMERNGEHRNEALVKSLPVVKYGVHDEEGKQMMKECAVCLSEFESGEMLRLLPACDHLFHKDCIDMWLFSHTTCPLCRLSLLSPKEGSLVSETSSHQQPMLPLDHIPPVATIA